MIKRTSEEIGRIIRDGTALDRAMVRTHRAVILRHRQDGVPLVLWRDGQVVEVDPFDVELPVVDEPGGPGTPEDVRHAVRPITPV